MQRWRKWERTRSRNEAEDVTELLKSHDKASKSEKLHLTDKQRKGFLERDSTQAERFCENCWNNTKDLEYYTDLVDKAAVRFGR